MSDENIIEMPEQTLILPPGYCQCGCGGKTRNGSRFIQGHNVRADKTHQAKIENHQWPKGKSANPGGRKKKPITAAYEALMQDRYPGDPLGRTGAELLALAIFKDAVANANVGAAAEITNRVEGKAPD